MSTEYEPDGCCTGRGAWVVAYCHNRKCDRFGEEQDFHGESWYGGFFVDLECRECYSTCEDDAPPNEEPEEESEDED